MGTLSSQLTSLVGDAPALSVGEVTAPCVVLGAFQRASSALSGQGVEGRAVLRRPSGGPALLAGPGTLRLLLTLPRVDLLVPDADVPRLVNRHVRPLLKALTRIGARAQYFGRDFVSVEHRPVGFVGFAHHAASGKALFEAFVALSHPFALSEQLSGYPPHDRFAGKAPQTASEASGKALDAGRAVALVADAYAQSYPGLSLTPLPPLSPVDPAAPPFTALCEDVIGYVGALREGGRVVVGGDMLASSDLVEALSCEAPVDAAVAERLLQEALDAGGVVEGLRDLGAIARVMASAT